MARELPALAQLADWHARLPRYAWVRQLAAGRRVLDLGCGSGDGASLLAEAGAREVVAVDPRAALIDAARARYDAPGLHFFVRTLDTQLLFEPEPAAAAPTPTGEPEDFDARATAVHLPAVPAPSDEPADAAPAAATGDEPVTEPQLEVAESPVERAAPEPAAPEPAGDEPATTSAELAVAEAQGEPQPAPAAAEAASTAEAAPQEDTAHEDAAHAPQDDDDESAQHVGGEAGNSDDDGARSEPFPQATFAAVVAPEEALAPVSAAEPEDVDATTTYVAGASEVAPAALPVGAVAGSNLVEGQFDLIVALDPHLPLGERSFLEALAARLSEGGQVVAAVRLDDAPTVGDVLATLERGRVGGEPAAPGLEAVREHFASVFGAVQVVPTTATLAARLEPTGAEASAEVLVAQDALAPVAHSALFVLGREPVSSLRPVQVTLGVDGVAAALERGVSSLLARSLGLEHRGVLFEEQLSQKESLIDDLERELRGAEQRRREVEQQLSRLREELDGLQGELTGPSSLPAAQAAKEAELQRGLDEREARIGRLVEELAHSHALVARLRESVEVQRATIEALRTRLQLEPLAVEASEAPEPEPVVDTASAEALAQAEARVTALEGAVAARDAEIGRLTAQVVELERAREESRAGVREAHASLERTREELRRTQRERERGQSETASVRAELEAARAAVAAEVARRESVEAEVESLRGELAALQVGVATRAAELEALERARQSLEEQLARFRRGRRSKRGSYGSPTES